MPNTGLSKSLVAGNQWLAGHLVLIRSHWRLATGFLLLVSVAGCGHSGGGDKVDKEKQHILHVVDLAKDYTAATNKKPTSMDDVKNWAIKEGKGTEADFVSPRDQQPYGLMTGMTGLLVYEQAGKNDKCLMYSTGSVREVNPGEVSRMKGLESMKRGGPPPGMRK